MNLDVEQCRVDGDCVARGPAFANTTCIDRTCQAVVVDSGPLVEAGRDVDPGPCGETISVSPVPGIQYKIELPIINLQRGTPPPSTATVKLCSRVDIACANPRAILIPDGTTGVVTTTVESGFNGYYEISGGGMNPSIYVPNPPIFKDTKLIAWQVLEEASFRFLGDAILGNKDGGAAIDPTLGHILIGSRDCTFVKPVENLSFLVEKIAPDNKSIPFYIVGGLPDPERTSTAADGSGGYINLPPGFQTVKAVPQGSSEPFGKTNVIIRAGFLTYSVILPGS